MAVTMPNLSFPDLTTTTSPDFFTPTKITPTITPFNMGPDALDVMIPSDFSGVAFPEITRGPTNLGAGPASFNLGETMTSFGDDVLSGIEGFFDGSGAIAGVSLESFAGFAGNVITAISAIDAAMKAGQKGQDLINTMAAARTELTTQATELQRNIAEWERDKRILKREFNKKKRDFEILKRNASQDLETQQTKDEASIVGSGVSTFGTPAQQFAGQVAELSEWINNANDDFDDYADDVTHARETLDTNISDAEDFHESILNIRDAINRRDTKTTAKLGLLKDFFDIGLSLVTFGLSDVIGEVTPFDTDYFFEAFGIDLSTIDTTGLTTEELEFLSKAGL
jgi:hypothetical protein